MTVHVSEPKTIEAQSLAQIFTDARTHNGFIDKPVSDELLRRAVELAKMGPTSVNQSPLRILFSRSRRPRSGSAGSVARQSGQDDERAGRRGHGL